MSYETPRDITPLAADEMYRHARLEVLHAYRSEFRKEAPAEMLPADSVDVSCIDRRVDEKKHQKQADGESYHLRTAAGIVAAYKEGVDAISTPGQLAIDVATKQFPKLHIVRVTGHTDCGAINELYEALRKDTPPEKLAEKAWMLPVPLEKVKDAITTAKENGASDTELRGKLEQLAILGSMANFYKYPVQDKATGKTSPLGDFVEKGLIIAGGMRDVVPDENGHRALLVFDPGEKNFIPVEQLYEKLFPGQAPSADTIETAYKASQQKQVAEKEPEMHTSVLPALVVPRGASSSTTAEFTLGDIRLGAQNLLNDIGQTGEVRK